MFEKELDNNEVVEEEVPQEEVIEENKEPEYKMPLPESEKVEEKKDEPNRPAHWSIRIAGGLIDICILFLAMLGFRTLYMMTPMGTAYTENYTEALKISDSYKLQPLVSGSDETFGYKLYEDEENYESYTKQGYYVYEDEEANKKYVVANYENISKELQNEFKAVVNADENFKNYSFNMRYIEFGIIALSLTTAEVIFLLAIPLLNKRRATIGKWAAGSQLINSKYQVEAKWYQIVGRFFWILTIESLVPLFFISSVIWSPVIVSIVLFLVTLTNKDRKTIHDFVCRTKVIDKRTFVRLNDQ